MKLPSVRFAVDRQLQQSVERMIRRNEKRPLAQALSKLEVSPSAPLLSNEWFMAASHKNGVGLVEILKQNNVFFDMVSPIEKAIERNLWDVAQAMAPSLLLLPNLMPLSSSCHHVLLKAAVAGKLDLLKSLFAIPVGIEWERGPYRPLPSSEKANLILAHMTAETRLSDEFGDVSPIVSWLVEQGGNVNYSLSKLSNVDEASQGSLLYRAVGVGQVALAEALLENGARLSGGHRTLASAFSSLIYRALRNSRNAKEPLPNCVWEVARFLLKNGIVLPAVEPSAPGCKAKLAAPAYSNYSIDISIDDADERRLLSLVEESRLLSKTAPSPIGKNRPGLRL